jgi:hypothetical protein
VLDSISQLQGIDVRGHHNDVEYAGSFATIAIDNGFDPETFERDLDFNIRSLSKTDMEVEISGIDAPLANTLRRVIMSEVGDQLTRFPPSRSIRLSCIRTPASSTTRCWHTD